MPNIATRLITLIMILQHQPEQTATVLASRLGVSVRTLHRYFGMLDEMGVPVYAERGRHGGFLSCVDTNFLRWSLPLKKL